MKIEEVEKWCRDHRVVARGVVRGAEFTISQDGTGNSTVHSPVQDIFHWELHIAGSRYPCSPSDMERLVTGKMTVDDFVKIMGPREGRRSE
ncbi:MAG: hypothetical protein ACREP8_08090 [Candidatus Binatia bacterium]